MNFIHYKENAVSLETCRSLINLFEDHTHLHRQGSVGISGASAVNTNYKQDTEIALNPDFFVPGNNWFEPLKDFMNSLSNEINEYKQNYSFFTDDFGIVGINGIAPWRVDPSFNIQRYEPGEGYHAWHCETPNPTPQYVTRMLVWMAYLNDVPDGGTEFKFQNAITEARTGSIVIWPPYWTHFHRGIVSHTTTKYIITGWCNFLPAGEK